MKAAVAARTSLARTLLGLVFLGTAACSDSRRDARAETRTEPQDHAVAADAGPPADARADGVSRLFPADTVPRLLTLASELDALSEDELGGPADGPWWALAGSPAALHQVAVRTGTLPHPCLPDDTSRSAWTVRLAAASAPAPDSTAILALLRGMRLVAGPVASATADSVFMTAESPAGGADSATYHFEGRPLTLARTNHGDGFTVHALWKGRSHVLYSTDTADEGSWKPVIVADINRDGEPDVLLHATPKYSMQVLRLLVTRRSSAGTEFVEFATSPRASC